MVRAAPQHWAPHRVACAIHAVPQLHLTFAAALLEGYSLLRGLLVDGVMQMFVADSSSAHRTARECSMTMIAAEAVAQRT